MNKMFIKFTFIATMGMAILQSCQSQSVEHQNWQWRGENSNGMYLNETGLLKSWATNGPELLWHFDGLGEGHTSVAISNEKIYITGMHDDRLFLYVLDMNGKLLNEKELGKEWNTNWNGTRSSVNINNGKLYIFNALGTLFVLDQATLNVVWTKDLLEEFGGRNLRFGMTENPLIVGDKLFMTPGGETHNMIALNKTTGELIWTSRGLGEPSAYGSPLYIAGYAVPMVVAHSAEHIFAINAETGEMLWSHPHSNGRFAIHPNIPIYSDGMIFATSGYEGGAILLRLTNNGRAVEQVWKNEELDNQMGSAIKVGNHIYASGHRNNFWFCVDWRTGETVYKIAHSGECNVIFADGMLYVYSDRGTMSLVRPNPERHELVSSFEVTLGTNQHWAHPVIYHGVMYLRHGDTLMAYKVK